MNTKLVWKIVGAGVLVAVVAVVFFYADVAQAPKQGTEIDTPTTSTVTLSIEGLYTDKKVSVASGWTLLQVLQELNTKDSAMQLAIKEYAGLGALVEGMGSLHNGDSGKYWQYKVNGVMPQIGADAYVLKDGEMAEWFFGTSEE